MSKDGTCQPFSGLIESRQSEDVMISKVSEEFFQGGEGGEGKPVLTTCFAAVIFAHSNKIISPLATPRKKSV